MVTLAAKSIVSKNDNEENTAMDAYSVNTSDVVMVPFVIVIDDDDDSDGSGGDTMNHHGEKNNTKVTNIVFKKLIILFLIPISPASLIQKMIMVNFTIFLPLRRIITFVQT